MQCSKINSGSYKSLSKVPLVWGTTDTKFGHCLMAYRNKALCYLSFYDKEPPLDNLKKIWGGTPLSESASVCQDLSNLFEDDSNLEVCLKGTDFELEVWEALLKVTKGKTASYEEVAKAIGRPKAVRAVGRAIGKNPVAYFVPCHRIIKKDGSLHKYASGVDRKVKMLKDEGAI